MSYNEWKKVKLADIAEITMGQSPSGDNCNNVGKGLPLLNGPTEFGYSHPIAVQFTTDPKKVCDIGDILFCVRGSTTGRMNWADKKYAIGRGLASIRHRNGKAYQHFIKGVIEYRLSEILMAATGSTFPNVSKDLLSSLQVDVPSLNEQKGISVLLSCLDAKIELNNRINKTLEEMAQAIFKQWFVDFDFPDENGQPYKSSGGEMEESELGLIPKGWKASNVYDNVFERKVKNSTGRKLPVLSVVKEGKFVISEEYFSKQVYSKDTSKYKVIQKNEVGYNPSRANIGSIAMLKEFAEGLLSPIYVIFKISDRISPFYFDYYMKRPGFIEKIAHHSSGTTRQNFNFEALKDFDIVIPPMEMQEKAYSYIAIIEKTIKQLSNQNNVLSDIRDSLLPKLMSGEIRVPIEEVPTSV